MGFVVGCVEMVVMYIVVRMQVSACKSEAHHIGNRFLETRLVQPRVLFYHGIEGIIFRNDCLLHAIAQEKLECCRVKLLL